MAVEVELRLPVDDTWTVYSGSPDPEYAHDTTIPQHRYAYDLIITDEAGASYDAAGDEATVASHYCFGEPVLAPADGTVIDTRTDHPDSARADGAPSPTYRTVYGNSIVIDHGAFVTVLAHLKQGSVRVAPGDQVQAGQHVGACGASGSVEEPQLHIHVQDRIPLSVGIGLPVRFTGAGAAAAPAFIHCGQRVCHHDSEVEPAGQQRSTPTVDSGVGRSEAPEDEG